MSLGMVIRQANQRYDEWSRRAIERFIAHVDHPQQKAAIRKHIGLRDLLTKGLDPRNKSRRENISRHG
jgi:hypothetical protein